ncbi:hypothetical protein KVR01_008090 [Diaporthe batatas]|uniref:uncharacterized protein n=1 Tax=Diaporthe batatas TaxID=748121 RepID=UPI001D05A977|nr:uncharacterized protein KVR01_008090 [Diaporthe batatas]KAG8162325.1 hypothetical protein KVR01_008090 [Diaporthe batatas]
MINLAGLPAIGGATMLGLRLERTFDCFSWSAMKPTTKKVAPAEQSSSLTTSSPSVTSSAPSKPLLWELLDACIHKDGAMDSFHSLVNKALSDVGLANPQSQDNSTSIESSQIPALSHGTTSCLDPHHSGGLVAQVPSCTTSPAHIRDTVEVTPFSALFPVHLLLEQAEPATLAKSNDLTASVAPPACHLKLSTLIYNDQISLDEILTNESISIEAEYPDRPSEDTYNQADSGRTSPHSGASIGEGVGSLSGNLNSSRRSSWATSISTSHAAVDDDDNCSLCSEKLESAADLEQNEDTIELELLQQYEHYSDLIDVGHPDNCHKIYFTTPTPGTEGGIDTATTEEDTQASDEPALEANGDTVTVTACPEAPATQAATYQPKEPDMGAATTEMEASHTEMEASHTEMEASHTADKPAAEATGYIVPEPVEALTTENRPEHAGEPAEPEISYGSYLQLQPPRTGPEEIAWVHSYCDVGPEGPRMEILSDERGREYVLYCDCFHVLPADMAPEFMPRENDDDDLDEPEPSDGEELSDENDGDDEDDDQDDHDHDHDEDNDRADGPAREDEERDDMLYAVPSDICLGTCLIYKFYEGGYYKKAWADYFDDTSAAPPSKRVPEIIRPSHLRYVESVDEMEDEMEEE